MGGEKGRRDRSFSRAPKQACREEYVMRGPRNLAVGSGFHLITCLYFYFPKFNDHWLRRFFGLTVPYSIHVLSMFGCARQKPALLPWLRGSSRYHRVELAQHLPDEDNESRTEDDIRPESGLLIEVGIFSPSNFVFLSSLWTKLAEIWYTFNLT